MLIGLTPDTIAGIIDKLKQVKFGEPVASMDECQHTQLSSCLKTPFLRPDFGNQTENFCEKATHLFYLLTEGHCFNNSNKRIAVSSLVTFADINGYQLNISEISLYALSVTIIMLSKYGLVEEAKLEINKAIMDTITKKPGSPISPTARKEMEEEFVLFMESKS